MRVATIATMRTLARARALARSLARRAPQWTIEIMLVGGRRAVGAAAAAEPELAVRSVSSLLDLDVEALLARHEEEALTVLLLPHVLTRLLAEAPQPVIHLPSSAWILAELEPLQGLLELHGVVLAPRTAQALPRDGLEPSAEQLERAGRIDPTLIGVDAGVAAAEFLTWWGRHTLEAFGSLDGMSVGYRPEDQPWLARFLELAPARFGTGVLDEAEFDLSLWNLDRHVLTQEHGRLIADGGRTVRLLNLPGFDPDRPYRLAANASRARVSRSPVLRPLCEAYAQELREAGWNDDEHRHDIGRRLAGGLVYDDALRSTYGRALALGEQFGDIFSEHGSAAFLSWLAEASPRGARYGINRYLLYRVSRERPDVLRTYPDLDGEDGPDFVRWCWGFGQQELGIPSEFMPPAPGAAPARARVWQRAETGPPAPEPALAPPEDAPDAPSVPAREPSGGPADSHEQASAGAELGVRLTGYMGHTLGLGAAARAYVEALRAAGIPVSTVTVPLHHLPLPVSLEDTYGRHGFEDLVGGGRHGFEIVAVNADELPDFVQRLGPEYFHGPRIGIWGWETNAIPERWQRAFALVDEIWVYSRFMAENIGAHARVPVLALPPPVQPPQENVVPTRLGVPGGFLFLFVFDYLSTVQRKNPVGLIEAFKLAFAPEEGPQLLIKTINGPLRPLSEEELLWAADGRPDIHVIDRSLETRELNGLMAGCDCYVSLHRAEGLGLTIAEAMAIGKPAIATGYSGNLDFMTAENSYLVDHTIGRVGPECEIYPPEGEWAEPNLEHAARLMREVHSDGEEAARRGARAREDIARLLSPAATGRRMRERLEHLAAEGGARRGLAVARG